MPSLSCVHWPSKQALEREDRLEIAACTEILEEAVLFPSTLGVQRLLDIFSVGGRESLGFNLQNLDLGLHFTGSSEHLAASVNAVGLQGFDLLALDLEAGLEARARDLAQELAGASRIGDSIEAPRSSLSVSVP